jgi:histidinol-phosphatase (PHP family)
MLDAARRMRISDLGVSDHWVLHPQGTIQKWAMHPDRVGAYVSELIALREEARRYGGTQVRIGLEVDWFPPRPAAPHPGLALCAALDQYPFDYLVGSVHEVDDFVIDGSPATWQRLSQDEVNQVHRRYWQIMRTLGEGDMFDIVAHIDLPKKFGFRATCDLSREIGQALDAIAAAPRRPVVELNTAGWHKTCACGYPSPEILVECRRREIPATISADAHQTDHLLRDFDRAALRLRDAGYTEVARFANRERWFEPLNDALRAQSTQAV